MGRILEYMAIPSRVRSRQHRQDIRMPPKSTRAVRIATSTARRRHCGPYLVQDLPLIRGADFQCVLPTGLRPNVP